MIQTDQPPLADGGFLQVGTPNSIDPSALLGETPCQCVFVTPAYRLNVFGFLASPELAEREGDAIGNFGFWDQRVALGKLLPALFQVGRNRAHQGRVGC